MHCSSEKGIYKYLDYKDVRTVQMAIVNIFVFIC